MSGSESARGRLCRREIQSPAPNHSPNQLARTRSPSLHPLLIIISRHTRWHRISIKSSQHPYSSPRSPLTLLFSLPLLPLWLSAPPRGSCSALRGQSFHLCQLAPFLSTHSNCVSVSSRAVAHRSPSQVYLASTHSVMSSLPDVCAQRTAQHSSPSHLAIPIR